MFFSVHGILITIYLITIIFVCYLFTNAIELLGSKLKLSNSATGSILAVIGTTLPETVIPIVAIIGSIIFQRPAGEQIALGAIIGSPFMLSALAMALIGFSLLFSGRKELEVNKNTILRFYKYFLITYTIGILTTFINNYGIKILAAVFLILSYVFFIKRTLKQSKEDFSKTEEEKLIFAVFFNIKKSGLFLILAQIAVSLFALIFSSHHFVKEMSTISRLLEFNPVVLSLIVTPFATELPECVNSIIWTKQKKDELAIANVLGAVIFQSVVPMSTGILFTSWILNGTILLNSLLVILCSVFIVSSVLIKKKLTCFDLIFCLLFYIGYIVFVLL